MQWTPGRPGPALRARIGPGALIVLAHVVLFVALLRHAGTPSVSDDKGSAVTMALTLIPFTAAPPPPTTVAPTTVPVSRQRRSTARRVQPEAVDLPAAAPSDAPDPGPEFLAPQGEKLDMEALRSAARRMEQQRLPTAPTRPREPEQLGTETDNALARGIRRAKRPDCQTAYAGGDKANLFMLIPLALDTIRDKGCKW